MTRLQRATIFALLLLLPTLSRASEHGPASAPVVFSDDFARSENGGPSSAWDTDAVGWSVHSRELESDGTGRSTAAPRSVPIGQSLFIEVTVTPHRATSDGWKAAGIAVRRDDGNYWQLALIERPASLGSGRFVELAEMRSEQWNAQSNLHVTADRGMDLNWAYDHPYRLRIELDSQGVAGTISEAGGAELARRSYRFGPPAVTSGAPTLTTNLVSAGFSAFRTEIRRPAPPQPSQAFPRYTTASAGFLHGRATGFFHVERIAGRWWIVDPAGRSYYAVGTDHVNYDVHWCEKLGYAPYHRNVEAEFKGVESAWAADSIARLKRWGFNVLGAGCGLSTRHRGLAHTEFVALGTPFAAVSNITPRTTWTGFPDVFHPRWKAWCEREARRVCLAQRGDPWLLGYFLDNELEWLGKEYVDAGLTIETFKKPGDHPAKRALVAFLRGRYHDAAAFNRAWETRAPGWDALAAAQTPPAIKTEAARRDARAFVLLIADRYFSIACGAIRKADPNHMILGCRFAGVAPPGVIGVAGRYCDIVSINFYGQVDLDRNVSTDMPTAMRRYYAEARRPLMTTEWGFPALDAGLPSRHGAGQRVATQREKARCFAIYQRSLFNLPFMVGSDYFMWADEPALGISTDFPEDSNYGLVDVANHAWPEVTAAAARVNREAQCLHAGDAAKLRTTIVDIGPRSGPGPAVFVVNRGRRQAAFALRIWIQGRATSRNLSLAPGAGARIPLATREPAFVIAEADPNESVVQSDRSGCRAEAAVNLGRSSSPCAVVVNPTGRSLADVPLAVSLERAGSFLSVRGLETQTDMLPGAPEIAWRAPLLPARSVTVFPLYATNPERSVRNPGGDRPIEIDAGLKLRHDVGSGKFFDAVSLGSLALGSYGAVIEQGGDPPQWISPQRISRIDSWRGPIRTVMLMTACLNTSPAVGATERAPGEFSVAYWLTCPAAAPWFTARFASIENIDTRSWSFAAYYHYPISAIGGHSDQDEPAGAAATPLWWNPKASACYGALLSSSIMHSTFYKDERDNGREHPDIWRDVRATLAPGEVLPGAGENDTVYLYGASGPNAGAGGDVLNMLVAIKRLRIRLVVRGRQGSGERL